MDNIVVYASKHGSSEKAAQMLQKSLPGSTQIINIKKSNVPNLKNFDNIIIGGSIHAGRIQTTILKFCQNNNATLKEKKLGLYLCCMDKEKAQEQFDNAYLPELREHAISTGLFGGEFLLERMNWFERKIVQKVAGVTQSLSSIDYKAIENFSSKFSEKI